MRRLGDTVARLSAAGKRPAGSTAGGRLRPFAFGANNPGDLDAFVFTPPTPSGGALVVVLHGCSQTAEAYDHGAGWSQHAQAKGFSVLFPHQRRANNPGLCFNWFSPDDTARDRGEAASIAAMIIAMVRDHDLDPGRVFITGLSAGGAMTAVLLSVYPELFAGGAIIAGLPYGAASSMPEAFAAMRGQAASPGPDRVRRAAPAADQWPRIAIVHGTGDRT
ncbi:MAG: LpqC, poly, partial [Brevundimonas sp.]|nr:LpqC, poly [Brevundimonas sp.]